MLAIVWTNPEKPQRRAQMIQRRLEDGYELILVNGTDVWTVFSSEPQLKCAGGL